MNDRQTTAFVVASVAAFLLYLNNRQGSSGASQLQEVLGVIRGVPVVAPGFVRPVQPGSPPSGTGRDADQRLNPGVGGPVLPLSWRMDWLTPVTPGNGPYYA